MTHRREITRRRWTVFALFCLLAGFGLAFYWSKPAHRAPVGVLIGFMGLVAAGITFRVKPTKWERAFWLVLMAVLLGFEVNNDYAARRGADGKI